MAPENPDYAFGIGHTGELQAHLKPFTEFLAEFNKETERGAALTAAGPVTKCDLHPLGSVPSFHSPQREVIGSVGRSTR
jgi:hypothetical protein